MKNFSFLTLEFLNFSNRPLHFKSHVTFLSYT
jgi:hypothetical protein